MKNLFKTGMIAVALFAAVQTYAQTHKDSTVGHKVGRTAKHVGHKTSELAAKGTSAVVDKVYDDKYGPHGETVYINKHSHYYYINKKGHRVYITKAQMRDEKED